MRFAIYVHKIVCQDGQLVEKPLIVLKDDGEIVGWTDFHKYIHPRHRVRDLTSTDLKRVNIVVKLLNFVFFEEYKIRSLNDMTNDMVISFLQRYGMCDLPGDDEYTHRTKDTVKVAYTVIMDFIEDFTKKNKKSKLVLKDFYTMKDVFSRTKKRYIEKRVPSFDILCSSTVTDPIFRDLTEKAFVIIMNRIMTHHQRLLMLAALGAFAGLRPGEACNVRRSDSPLGPGMLWEIVDGKVENITIDLTKELDLRSDHLSVGKIKKARRQQVYPPFLIAFTDCYNQYNKYLEGKKCEAEYMPLSVNRQGKCITYDSYASEFREVIKECIPIMLADEDPEVVNYGHLLMTHNISPHIFRHWFSVKLTLYGEDVAGIQFWRGDSSPESAITYLQNKGDIVKKYEKVSGAVTEYALWKAEKIREADRDH